MRNLKLGLIAAAAMFAAACGKGGVSDACTTDADCEEDQICHTLAKACVKSCTDNDDCTTQSPTCASLLGVTSDGGTPKFCQCTATSCGSDATCSDTYKVCLAECEGDDCEAAATCDSTDPQPSTCSNGQFCSGTAC